MPELISRTKREEFLALSSSCLEAISFANTRESDFTALERQVDAFGEALKRKLMELRLAEDPRAKANVGCTCPACSWKLRIQEPSQWRSLTAIFGEIGYYRAYGVCDRCGYTGAPLDVSLGIPRTGPSVGVLTRICHAAALNRSFKDAGEMLSVHSGIKFSGKHIRALAERTGAKLVDERDADTSFYKTHKLEIKSGETPEILVVCADGGRVQTRQAEKKERWKENKIGVVYDAEARPGLNAGLGDYEGARSKIKTYIATMWPWEEAGWILRLEAERRGYLNAKIKLFLADGARSIRELKNTHFSDSVFIIDWCHVVGHLSDCGKAIHGEGTREYYRWYEKQKQRLWNGQVDVIIRELKKHSRRLGKPQKDDNIAGASPQVVLFRNAYSYFPNNMDAMDYPTYRQKGWPIGSGVVEGSVKQLGLRLKGSEKFWNISGTGAEEMLALCALYRSEDGRWDNYWRRRAQPEHNTEKIFSTQSAQTFKMQRAAIATA